MAKDAENYGPSFFRAIRPGARSSARRILPFVFSVLRPASVIDVGCGDGTWLQECAALGVPTLVGVDGFGSSETGTFHRLPLDAPLPPLGQFDLAISVEVAEHLPASHADRFVADLVRLAPAILFSAALPGQGGVHHINEEWADRWAARFRSHGYACVDVLRAAFWNDPQVDWWYAQNAVLFFSSPPPVWKPAVVEQPLRLIHPDLYELYRHDRSHLEQMSVRQAVGHLYDAARRSFHRRLGR